MPRLLPPTDRFGRPLPARKRERGIRVFVGRLTTIAGTTLCRLFVPRGAIFRVLDANGDVVEDRREPRRAWWATPDAECIVSDRDPAVAEAVCHARILEVGQDAMTMRARLAREWTWGSEVFVMPIKAAPARSAA
jgi:hypothetical protein